MRRSQLLALSLLVAGCASSRNSTANRIDKEVVHREIVIPTGLATDLREMSCYSDPMDSTHFGNAFRMSNGHIVAISLLAKSDRGRYSGDEVMIYDLTANLMDRLEKTEVCRNKPVINDLYRVTFKKTGEDVLMSLDGNAVSFNDIFRWRTQGTSEEIAVGDKKFKFRYQARDSAVLFFSEKATTAWLDPSVPPEEFAPTYVVPMRRKLADGTWEEISESAIGDTGYVLQRQSDGWLKRDPRKMSPDLSASDLISKRIADFGDWRGTTPARMRKLAHEAHPEVIDSRDDT